MKAPTVTRILPSIIYPKWMNGILEALNSFLIQVTSGLNKNITFEENIQSQKIEINFTTLSTYSAGDFNTIKFSKDFRAKGFGLFIAQIQETGTSPAVIKSPVSIQWEQIESYIYINYISGLDDSTSYTIQLLLI